MMTTMIPNIFTKLNRFHSVKKRKELRFYQLISIDFITQLNYLTKIYQSINLKVTGKQRFSRNFEEMFS